MQQALRTITIPWWGRSHHHPSCSHYDRKTPAKATVSRDLCAWLGDRKNGGWRSLGGGLEDEAIAETPENSPVRLLIDLDVFSFFRFLKLIHLRKKLYTVDIREVFAKDLAILLFWEKHIHIKQFEGIAKKYCYSLSTLLGYACFMIHWPFLRRRMYYDKLFISSGKRSDFGMATRFGTRFLGLFRCGEKIIYRLLDFINSQWNDVCTLAIRLIRYSANIVPSAPGL
jgi:hypothetical protein